MDDFPITFRLPGYAPKLSPEEQAALEEDARALTREQHQLQQMREAMIAARQGLSRFEQAKAMPPVPRSREDATWALGALPLAASLAYSPATPAILQRMLPQRLLPLANLATEALMDRAFYEPVAIVTGEEAPTVSDIGEDMAIAGGFRGAGRAMGSGVRSARRLGQRAMQRGASVRDAVLGRLRR